METPAGKKQASGLSNKKIIVIGAAIIALLVAAIAFLLMRQSTMNIADEGVPKIGRRGHSNARSKFLAGGNGCGNGKDKGWERSIAL